MQSGGQAVTALSVVVQSVSVLRVTAARPDPLSAQDSRLHQSTLGKCGPSMTKQVTQEGIWSGCQGVGQRAGMNPTDKPLQPTVLRPFVPVVLRGELAILGAIEVKGWSKEVGHFHPGSMAGYDGVQPVSAKFNIILNPNPYI